MAKVKRVKQEKTETKIKEIKPQFNENIERTKENTEKIQQELNSNNSDMIEIKELPSNFLPYEINTIFIRKLKFKEVKLLSRAVGNTTLNYLIKSHQNAILNINVEELIPVDLKFLVLAIARITKPEFRMTYSIFCNNEDCKYYTEPFIKDIDPLTFDYQELKKEYIDYQNIRFYPLRIRDLLFLEKYEKQFEEKIEDYLDDLTINILTLMSNPQISKEKNLDLFIEQYKIISELDYSEELENIANELFPDLNEYKVNCPNCGSEISFVPEIDFSKIYL